MSDWSSDVVYADLSNAVLLDAGLLSQPLAPSEADPQAKAAAHRAYLQHHDLIPFHTERLVRASLPSRLLAVAEAARLLKMSKRSLQRSSEERRVGKEGVRSCRSRWSPVNEKKNTEK